MKDLRARFLVFITGILAAVIVLEAGLRLSGALCGPRGNAGTKTGKGYIIVCVGDSFTYGFGAPAEKAMPSQLGDLLNTHEAGKTFTVINCGVGAQNTTLLREELPMILNRYKPDLVVLLSGMANLWHYRGYYTYVKGRSTVSLFQDLLYSSSVYKLVKLLYFNVNQKMEGSSRGQRLSQLASGSTPALDTFGSGMRLLETGDHEQALSVFRDLLALSPQDPRAYFGLGSVYLNRREFEEARKVFEKGIAVQPRDPSNYSGMARYYKEQRDHQQALSWFKKALELNPGDSRQYLNIAFLYLDRRDYSPALIWLQEALRLDAGDSRNCYAMGKYHKDQGQYEEAVPWYKKGIEVDPKDWINYYGMGMSYCERKKFKEALPWVQQGIKADQASVNNLNYKLLVQIAQNERKPEKIGDFLRELERFGPVPQDISRLFDGQMSFEEKVKAWVESDLEEIIKMCKEKKVRLIMHNYPWGWDLLSGTIKKAAERSGVPFVDNRRVFDELWQKGEKHEDYAALDGHCNGKGYGVIAMNIYEKLRKLDWFAAVREGGE